MAHCSDTNPWRRHGGNRIFADDKLHPRQDQWACLGKKLTPIVKTALDNVVTAAPPSKRSEVEEAMTKQKLIAMAMVARSTGDKEKLGAYIMAQKMATKLVTGAPAAEEFSVMETTFIEAAHLIP